MPILDHRPRSAWELVDAAFALVRHDFVRYALVAACCIVPLQVAQLVIMQVTKLDLRDPQRIDVGAVSLLVLSALLFTALAEAAVAWAVAQSYEGRDEVDVPAALRAGLARWLPAFGATLLKYVMVAAFGVIGIIVGMLLGVAIMLAVGVRDPQSPAMLAVTAVVMLLGFVTALPAIGRLVLVPTTAVLERRNPLAAIGRSRELTKGLWRHAVGAWLLAFLVAIVPYVGASLLAGLLGPQIVQQAVGVIVTVALFPVYVASVTVLYYDLRIRKEGFDLELMANRLATAVPDAGPDVPATGGA